jgi:hypothetical protein
MNELEKKLHDKNPKVTPRLDFVDSVMAALPEAPDKKNKFSAALRVLSLPFGAAAAGVATFALFAFVILPSVREIGQKNPEVSRDTGTNFADTQLTIEEMPIVEQTMELLPIEQEITFIESDVTQLEKEIADLESDLSDQSLGL